MALGWTQDYSRDLALDWGPIAAPVLAALTAAVVVGRGWWARRCPPGEA